MVMRDLKLVAAASYTVGDQIALSLIPFAEADPTVRRTRRLDDGADLSLDLYYATTDTAVPEGG